MRDRPTLTLLLFAALGPACSTEGTPLDRPRSFLVQGKLTVKPTPGRHGVGAGAVPEQHDFILHLDPTARTLVLGGPHTAARAPITSSDGVTFVTTTSVWASLPGSNCGSANVTYSKLVVTVRGDRVEGTGVGEANVTGGDQADSFAIELTFSGSPDDVPPEFGPDLPNVDPLADLFIATSEPLPPGSSARLVSADGAAPEVKLWPLAGMEVGGVVSGFSKPNATALVPGTRYELVIAPGSDLAGNVAGPRKVAVTTRPAPPLLPADNLGFEDPATSTVGGAMIVDASVLPPIAGQRSLLLPPSSVEGGGGEQRFTVRLAVPAAAATLRLQARFVSASPDGHSDLDILVAAPGGAITRPAVLDRAGPLVRQPGPALPGGQLFLGEVRSLELPLPAGHGGEVIVDASVGYPGAACGPLPPTMGVLLDDLRVE